MLLRVACVLLFLGWTAEAPNDSALYTGFWRSPFALLGPLFVSVPGLGLSPWQISLAALALLSLLTPAAFRGRAWAMDGAILTSLLSVCVTFLWGLARGGSAYNAYFQLWRFLFALLVCWLLCATVHRPRDLRPLGFALLAAAFTRATLAMYFYWVHVRGRLDPPPLHMTSHDDSLLWVAAILVLLSWAFASRRMVIWMGTALATGYLAYAMVLNNRRLAWLALALSLPCVYFLLPGPTRRRTNRVLLVVAPIVLLYTAVGWGRSGVLFTPLKAFSTAGSHEDASSLARLEEIRNLVYTLSVAGNPLLGTGWGMPYQKVTSVYANFSEEFWQYAYLPHNSLLGVAVFGGLVGVLGIWIVVPVAAYLATQGYRSTQDRTVRAAAMAAVCILPAYGVQCYGDIGFQSLGSSLVLAVALATAARASVPSLAGPGAGAHRTRAEPPASRQPLPTHAPHTSRTVYR